MALLATLEGLGVPTRKNGGIFGACLGACDAVGATVYGCLGDAESEYEKFAGYKDYIDSKKADGTYWSIKRDWIYKMNPDLISLGQFNFPIFNFNRNYEVLKKNSPTTSPEALAATVYFSMLASQPVPTTEKNVLYHGDYDKESGNVYGKHGKVRIEDWDILEDCLSNADWLYSIIYAKKYWKAANAQEAYYEKLKQLQQYLQGMGLWGGIQKTLSEESRKLQAQAAAASASAAAAAKALAMARINADVSQEGRFEAAEQQAKAEADYKNALDNEEKIKKALDNVSKGLPADTPDLPDKKTEETISSVLPLLGLAAAAALAFMG